MDFFKIRPEKPGKVMELKKRLKILKSLLFQTLNNYFRIFRCYQKANGRREGKRKWKLEKKENIRQNAIQLEKQKELKGIKEEIHQLIKARWIYI